jgi:hypothetical protein
MTTLTRHQKRNLQNLGIIALCVCIAGAVVFGLVLLFSSLGSTQATVNPPAPPQVNARNFEQINTANDETVDHYCVGKDGLFFGQSTGDFSVAVNDPLCK